MSDCVIAIDHAEQQELLALADKSERLAKFIHAGFPTANSGDCLPAFTDCGAGYVILDDRTIVAILAPRTLEIALGRPLPNLKLKASRRYKRLCERVKGLFSLTTPIDPHTFAVEFEGAIFNVEITRRDDDDIRSEAFFGYEAGLDIGTKELLERGASGWLYDVFCPPTYIWTPYKTTQAFYERPDVGMKF